MWAVPSLLSLSISNLKSRVHTVLAGEIIQTRHSTPIRSNSPLRIVLKFEEMLKSIVAVVGSSQTHSMSAQVHVRYLDRPATPTGEFMVSSIETVVAITNSY